MTMRERIFRITNCDGDDCEILENKQCFSIQRYGIESCIKANYEDVSEDWICDGCKKEFDKLEKKFIIPTAPESENGKTVKTYIIFKTFCETCNNTS